MIRELLVSRPSRVDNRNMRVMRQYLAELLCTAALAGCSVIYNPSNLPDKTVTPDAAVADANPALLRLDEVKSPVLLEGAGQDGSAPQILVVYGMHITQGATVTIAPKTPNADVAIEVASVSIAHDGNSFAALVSAGYMDNLDETGPNAFGEIALAITVTQDGATPQSIDWGLRPLDELAAGTQAAPGADKLFSRAEVAGDVIFMPGPTRAIVKTVGKLDISGKVTANANGRAAGAGGCAGGMATQSGECFGAGKGGGGGAGFALPGTNGAQNTAGPASGDPLIKIYDGVGVAMNRGGGGGGGDGAVGGGGGGTIELTAGGDLRVGTLEAKGAGGESSGLGRGGGGGSGGAVVLRAGGSLALPTAIDLAGAGGGNGTLGLGPGGDGALGRWRFDASAVTGTPPMTPAPRRGPMIVRPANPIFEMKKVTLMVAGDPINNSAVTLVVVYPDETTETKNVTLTGEVSSVTPPELQIGLNTVCVLVPGGAFVNDEAKNCVDVAFVP